MNDNTTRHGDALFQDTGADGTGTLAAVRNGMTVVDVTGEEVGTVEHVKLGDPAAVTAHGSTPAPADLGSILVAAVVGSEPDVPEPKHSQLLRYGFVKVDGSGLTDADRYVRGDKVLGVSGDTVWLKVRKDQLLVED